ncbi:MAG: DUF4062 domain-containing protein [Firmicutes bacterium]|nr:DUF4062 domain-containing protein [Bacillota bacterium]
MATKETAESQVPLKIFVSSTYSDMLPYREAIRNALIKAACVPMGMERFGAASIPPLEKCYEELASCQMYICALGMRYGSIDQDTQKSYTQLEYERARKLKLPILVFLVNEEKVAFRMNDIDMGESGKKLKSFKADILASKEILCSFFDSASALEETVYRSVYDEMGRQRTRSEKNEDFLQGAKSFSNFVKRPELHKNIEVFLRVRMDGLFSSWRVKDTIYNAFGLVAGETLYLHDLFVLGASKIDVEADDWLIDCFATGEAANWLDKNSISQGSVFEGKFKLTYELVKNLSKDGYDSKTAKLILIEGINIIS